MMKNIFKGTIIAGLAAIVMIAGSDKAQAAELTKKDILDYKIQCCVDETIDGIAEDGVKNITSSCRFYDDEYVIWIGGDDIKYGHFDLITTARMTYKFRKASIEDLLDGDVDDLFETSDMVVYINGIEVNRYY